MEKGIEHALEDSASYVKRRSELEPSFFGLLLYNFARGKTSRISRYASSFSRKNNLHAQIIDSTKKPYDEIYEYILRRKKKTKIPLFIILDPFSEIAKEGDIIKNCFSIDLGYFKD